MRKIIIVIVVLFLSGCINNPSPRKEVEVYLKSYQDLSSDVKKQVDEIISQNKEFSKVHKKLYKEILYEQYKSLRYNIIDEETTKDKSLVKVSINVRDLNMANKNAENELSKNLKEFYDKDNVFNNDKYISYKLKLMKNEKSRIDYEVIFYLEKVNGKWKLIQPTDEDLEKIHGVYEENIT